MTAGTPVEGTVCVDGVDYFSIELAEGGTATAPLTHTVLDGETALADTTDQSGEDTKVLCHTASVADALYLAVRGDGVANADPWSSTWRRQREAACRSIPVGRLR